MTELSQLTAEWNAARILYPTYSALAREFVIDLTSCNDLETGVDQPPQESVEQARQWLNDMDERIQIHQLRQFLQTTTLVTPQLLQTMLLHHLHKDEKSPSDRDKIDFLIVQLFSLAAPSRLEDSSVTIAYVAKTLQPVLGAVDSSEYRSGCSRSRTSCNRRRKRALSMNFCTAEFSSRAASSRYKAARITFCRSP